MADAVNPAAPKEGFVARALKGHAALGLLTGALLYLVCLSGALAVFQQDLQRWEEPSAAEMTSISPAAVQRAIEGTLERQGKATDHAFVHMPTRGLPRTIVTTDNGANYVDAQGNYDRAEAHAWTQFVLYLHYYLNLPAFWGIMVTGALGAMLVAAVVTGVLAHPRIFRDAFRMRLRAQPQLARADLHNRFGVWLLPFIAALGFTGAVIGLGQLVFYTAAQERHGGNLEEAFAPIFGEHPAHDPAPAPVARADRALEWMAQNHPDLFVSYVTIEETATAGQQISVLAEHPRRLIYGENYLFDGAGNFKKALGLADGALGQQAAASVYKLHFGTYGGIPVELAYLVFGLALCAIISTGTTLWLMKRRARGLPSPRLEAVWAVTIWGSPILMTGAYWLRVVAGPQLPFAALFWSALVLATILAALRPALAPSPTLRRVLAAMLVLTGIGHVIFAGPLPVSSLLIDAALCLGALALLGPEALHLLRRERAGKARLAPQS
ncbi:PepSY-associated TM helix domain-containing protein [Novosphingobium decolorationis]|uniref:PepSY domain-containing protein n=1 Tax=Novosphingobium decolorationis TaxID=2698673 RepID=A0ABX8E3R8_9SPHN|nr:PepSY-associated TM helix domain-containing protein [Novosphingobium decolorationis]QVM83269.1 PepSY domain-containing protein [Novosphingobium decolorationis]